MKARVIGWLAGTAIVLAALAPAAHAASSPAKGTESYFDLARKDCVGTARNTNSKVWFTVADGVLSDTYWPTVDATNVNTLQYLVTDGQRFTDLQTRDMTYRVIPDSTGMSCTVVASPVDATHGYRIVTTYIADPSRDAVLMRVHFEGPHADQLYVRLDPLAGGTGGGGDQNAGGNTAQVDTVGGQAVPLASNTNTHTDAVNRDYAVPTYMALASSSGFSTASVGYAGTASDGLTMLDSTHTLAPSPLAQDGHVALTAAVQRQGDRPVTLALAFAQTEGDALTAATAAAAQRFDAAWARYEDQWLRYDAGLRRPSRRLGTAAVREYYESVNVVKASEDKTYPGAIAAGLASPWGQSVPAGTLDPGDGLPKYFGSYREVFARDLYEAFTGLLVAGDVRTARDATLFLFERQQQPDGSMPRNSLENGKPAPDTGGLQLDETSYPILMAWQSGLAQYPSPRNPTLYTQHVIPAADFLVAHGPSDGVERWEEQSGYSPSTIAAEIAGLTAAAQIASVNHDPVHAEIYQATADYFARNVKGWTVTTDGPLAPRYFIRLSKAGDPNAASTYSLNNGNATQEPQQNVIDAGFLELVRLGVLPASDPDVQASLTVVDTIIKRSTGSGPGFYRYGYSPTESTDGYGDCFVPPSPLPNPTGCPQTGAPWPPTDTGTGHLWPVLSGERGEYDVAAGDFASAGGLLTAMRNMTSGQGLEPEQAWEDPDLGASPFGSDPATASIGFVNGKPAGSASPLTWAQAQYARLALALSNGRNLETPDIVVRRYVTRGMPGSLPVTITSPTSNENVDSSTVTVSGTTTPGATVAAESLAAVGGVPGTASTTADPHTGAWSLSLPVGFGSTTITVTATLGRRTGYGQVTVTNVALPGNTVLDVADPSGDDNGPGTYEYPTAADFHAGAFDLTRFLVREDGTNVYMQATLRNMDPTFGNTFGAQLLDVYVHAPGATPTSSGAAASTFNYGVTPAWSQLLQAEGFEPPIWKDPTGASLGSAQFVADQASRTATLIVPESTFGTPGSGWAFAVALTGQDGFSGDRARSFASTPQQYQFGVCAPGGTAPICSVDPGTVPKVMDAITPPGVSQATELDPTLGPVVLQGVSVP